MTAAPGLYASHQRLLEIARDFSVPGLEREDVRQEARLALLPSTLQCGYAHRDFGDENDAPIGVA